MFKILFTKTLLFSVILLVFKEAKSQNLVLNESFEQYTSCPSNFSQVDSALFWMNPTTNIPGISGSPDYFNQCATSPSLGVPDNNFGNQPARTGGAYTGLIAFYSGPNQNYREYVEGSLTAPLISNQCYHFEMYACLAEHSVLSTDDIQIYFSDTPAAGINNYSPLPFTPQINNAAGFITDTLNWTLISGNYVAAGGESYLIIGNFKDDATTTTQPTGFGFFQEAYYYIDDVSLTPCTGIDVPDFQNFEYLVYPNPVKDWLNVQISPDKNRDQNKKAEIRITDILGKEIYRNQFHPDNYRDDFRLRTSDFKNGIYFIKITNGENIFRKRFIKSKP